MSEQLNEVFDSDSDKNYPVVNLNLKSKVPQIWSIKVPDNENLVARMVSYMSEGDAIKQVKMGDKYAHVILMSLSAKGTPAELKGGLGSNPIGSINTIFDTVYEQVKKLRMDAIMFRFPSKKMKGQGPVLQRLISRLCMARTGGKFKVLDAMFNFTGKHTYILVYRKSKPIEDISGIPGINKELYTKVDSEVGEVWISKKDGRQVTKEEAVAGSIDEIEKTRTDIAVIRRTKISRRQVAASQALSTDFIYDPERFEEYENSAFEFSKPATAKVIPQAEELRLAIESKASKQTAVNSSAKSLSYVMKGSLKMDAQQFSSFADKFSKDLSSRIGNAPLTSVDSMKAYASTLLDAIDTARPEIMQRIIDKIPAHLEQKDKNQMIDNLWNIERSKVISNGLRAWSRDASTNINMITSARSPKQYTAAEKRGIKEYVGSAYRDINDMLLGRYRDNDYEVLTEPEVTKAIANLDAAFKKGDRIPEGMTLWRSQGIRKPIYDSLVKNKVFYFRNYVSTSLYPIIFGTWKGNQAVAVLPDEAREDLNLPGTSIESVKLNKKSNAEMGRTNEYYAAEDKRQEELVKVTVGWAISGAHKINVIYPGDLSNMPGEMEIILPRGTTVQVNKITNASYSDGLEYSNNKFIEAEIMTSEQIDESMVVYDGDVLVESGELVPMGAGAMVSTDGEDTDISASTFLTTKRDILSILASYIDIDDIPEKFVE